MKADGTSMLIVDDEVEILQTFKDIFEIRGWRIFTAPAGEPALAILKKEKIDIVLLDIRLPGKSGMEILKEMKSKYHNLPVVMITALGYDDHLINESIGLGASGYISKNIPIKDMIEVINTALKK